MNIQTSHSKDNSISARINRAITGAFTFAMIGAVGVMTFAQYMHTF